MFPRNIVTRGLDGDVWKLNVMRLEETGYVDNFLRLFLAVMLLGV